MWFSHLKTIKKGIHPFQPKTLSSVQITPTTGSTSFCLNIHFHWIWMPKKRLYTKTAGSELCDRLKREVNCKHLAEQIGFKRDCMMSLLWEGEKKQCASWWTVSELQFWAEAVIHSQETLSRFKDSEQQRWYCSFLTLVSTLGLFLSQLHYGRVLHSNAAWTSESQWKQQIKAGKDPPPMIPANLHVYLFNIRLPVLIFQHSLLMQHLADCQISDPGASQQHLNTSHSDFTFS